MRILPEAVLFLVVSGFMAVLIPREAYRRLFPSALTFGVLGPLFGAWLLQRFGVQLSYTSFLTASFNIWLLLAWVPHILIYLYFLPERGSARFWVYAVSFATLSFVIWRSFAYAHRVANLHPILIWVLPFAGYTAAAYLHPYLERRDHR